ncbi:hypothetical protein Sjap_010894 [Stephania japonica]|uniref:Uncharacterized protein n=1 Tax=Stephania japonica TaxID=461633 RepID=A0AAP0JA20_9MAGN
MPPLVLRLLPSSASFTSSLSVCLSVSLSPVTHALSVVWRVRCHHLLSDVSAATTCCPPLVEAPLSLFVVCLVLRLPLLSSLTWSPPPACRYDSMWDYPNISNSKIDDDDGDSGERSMMMIDGEVKSFSW